MKSQTTINGIKQGIDNNQSLEEIDEIIEQIKVTRCMTLIGDGVKIGTDKYIIEIRKIN